MAPFTPKVTAPTGFRPLGQDIIDKPSSGFGTVVALNDDGTTMAVAGQDSVSVFRRDDSTAVEDIGEAQWTNIPMDIPFAGKLGSLSLSGDGELLAVRNAETLDIHGINNGDMTTLTVCKDGKNVKLGQTPASSNFGAMYWLVVSCEFHDDNRGQIEIWGFDNASSHWFPYTVMTGQHPRALFGWSTDFHVNQDTDAPMVAVGSPFFEKKQGMVQVFELGSTGGYQLIGSDIVGQAQGDKFGFAVAISTIEKPSYMVVGAPECGAHDHGCVSIYALSGASNAGGPQWQQVGDTITGAHNNERFGRSVAISKSGNRFAASSVRSNSQTGVVRLFEQGSTTPIGVFEGGAPRGQWGYSVALNYGGSMVASASLATGSAQVFLDHTPFCSLPVSAYSNNEMFLARPMCKDYGSFVTTESECVRTHSKAHDNACVWTTDLSTRQPSSMPSFSPSLSPSQMPSELPSTQPSDLPSVSPSMAPTLSMAPSDVPSSLPSNSPTYSQMPSASPSMAPSLSPALRRRSSSGASAQTPWSLIFALGFIVFAVVTCFRCCIPKDESQPQKKKGGNKRKAQKKQSDDGEPTPTGSDEQV